MASVQRRRGIPVKIYPTVVQTDNRGNRIEMPDLDNPIETTAAWIPQRSARAEVVGEVGINVVRIIVRHELPNVDLWSYVEAHGRMWDVVTPPSYHHGTRHSRHWSMDLRERP
jgi:hypothetical protein